MSFKNFSSNLNTEKKTAANDGPKAMPVHDRPTAPAAKTPTEAQVPDNKG
ncbi:hypothetical protein GCM10017083_07500 [Thalassobaculum fulvum]|jgi:hypothetical protein|uniref:Uncharacterized protein n=1 Tax=Thalassobaculum fulvum TaxID=1633335 RepID=A0A918XQ28_9PROT|nr:hypothetical protein [Thalassobaculum fulvum]GHD42452.1 hypothetical protein GCM10017083_07500 [Thalassobaculum fulvum]